MQVFQITLSQILLLFALMAVGFGFNRSGLMPKETSRVLSRLETYLFLPCLNFKTFYDSLRMDKLQVAGELLLYGTVTMAASFLIATLISRFFAKEGYEKGVYAYSFTISNMGFMGNALVQGVFGAETFFQYMMFQIPFLIFIYTYGMYVLVPRQEGKGFTLKHLANPSLVGLGLGAVFGLLEIPLPSFLTGTVSAAATCMSPVAMLIVGFVLANYSLKKLSKNVRIYISCVVRLVAIPLAVYLLMRVLQVGENVMRVAVCISALPMGLNTIVFPEAYGGDATTGAAMALISHIMAIITMPVLFGLLL